MSQHFIQYVRVRKSSLKKKFSQIEKFSFLFLSRIFREIAYQAMDRRDLLNGIHDFLSDSIVLPPGDFDKELLLPVIETAKMKMPKLNDVQHDERNLQIIRQTKIRLIRQI